MPFYPSHRILRRRRNKKMRLPSICLMWRDNIAEPIVSFHFYSLLITVRNKITHREKKTTTHIQRDRAMGIFWNEEATLPFNNNNNRNGNNNIKKQQIYHLWNKFHSSRAIDLKYIELSNENLSSPFSRNQKRIIKKKKI